MLVMTRIDFACFCSVIIGLATMSGGEVRVAGGGGRVLCFEIAFRFPVMLRGLLIMVRCVVMMARRRMLTGHV
jgi:L-cystine uptake protein TcyP (sodium:dicarboxylate symporter family)